MPKNQMKEKALPVGLFILLAVILLTGGLIWVRNWQNRPAYSFVAAFNDPDRVSPGIGVFYRGVQVGRVTDVALDRDFDSTLVTIGISESGLRLSEAVEIHVRMEGITGQRYIEIEPTAEPVTAYIQPGEIVRGQDNVTWDQLQNQLARIAEERTLEKLLTSSQEAVKDIEIMASAMRGFFHDTRGPARDAVTQFNDTAQAIELAAQDFRGVVGPARDALPRITASIEHFGRGTEGMDEALVSIRTAADRFGGVADTFNRQLLETGLIGETADTVRSLRSGMGEALGSFRGTSDQIGRTFETVNAEVLPVVRDATGEARAGIQEARAGVSGVREALSGDSEDMRRVRQLAEAGRQLESRLQAVSPEILEVPQVRRDVERLAGLTRAIDVQTRTLEQTLESPPTGENLEKVRRQLASLKQLGDETAEASNRVRPLLEVSLAEEVRAFERRSARGEMIPPRLTAANQMVATLEELGDTGQRLSAAVTRVQPQLETLGPGQRAGGLFGGIAGTIRQVRHTAARFDCLAAQASDLLGERFLGFKLFFGAPGQQIECDTPEDLRRYSLLERTK